MTTLPKQLENVSITPIKEYDLPRRPEPGKKGRQITLRSNFFEVKYFPDEIIHYDVAISDGKTDDNFPKVLNLLIIEELVRLNGNIFQKRPVYDRRKSLYSIDELPFKSKMFAVAVMEDERERTFQVNLKLAAKINMRALHQAVEGRQRLLTQESIVALDIVLHYSATLKKKALGSRFFTSDGAIPIGMGLEIWRGYYQSARQGWKRVLVNINMASSLFLREIRVLDYLNEITKHDVKKNKGVLSEINRRKFTREIKNVQICATHRRPHKKYRVKGLTKDGASTQTFPFEKDGSTVQMTVKNYFEKELNVQLRCPQLPCLHVGKKTGTIYLPMEVCHIVKGQRAFHRLTDKQQKAEMIRHTAMKPSVRFRKIQETGLNNLRNDVCLETFNVRVGKTMLDVPGRILETPGIIYKQGQPLKPSSGQWNMNNQTLYQGAVIENWGLLVYGEEFPANEIDRFQNCLTRAAGRIGMRFGNCHFQRIANEGESAASLVTEALIKALKLQLLVVILPEKSPFYADLKRICETESGSLEIKDDRVRQVLGKNGLATQCIQTEKASSCKDVILKQLCLKINSKMGGANNAIAKDAITRPPRIFQEPVIFLGAGVTHPGPRDESSPSIGAVVGSIDEIPSRYTAAVRIMKHHMEIIEDLCSITKEMLKAYYRRMRAKPKKIIMFRDGVSEGQFQQVLFYEMRAIQKACSELEENYQPAITFIVAVKRHHGRFAVINQRNGDGFENLGNCQPGTTIDKEVCHPTIFDYYQFGHAAIQGTSRPTKYHVLWDDSNFSSDEIQALSFMLCHLYVRCTRSVSLPAPAYYADLLATRAACYLTGNDRADAASAGTTDSDELDEKTISDLQEIIEPHPNLAHRMYFV